MKVLHVSPTYYSADSIIGGGEKYIIYMIRALNQGMKRVGGSIENYLLTFGDRTGRYTLNGDINCRVISGTPWDPYSISLPDLLFEINQVDVVIVHQCLTAFGMFVGSHANLAGKFVLGIDEGGGEHPLVTHTSEAGSMFNLFLAYSQFAANSFADLDVPIKVILGPVDTSYYTPPIANERDPHLVFAVGRLLPHKGFDRIIKVLPKPLRLIIAGTRSNSEYFDYLQSLIRSSTCEISIEESLSDEQVRALMRRASIFVHASTHVDYKGVYYAKPELLGLAPLEALACGTPTLVSTAGSLGELASVIGCQTFSSDSDLAEILSSHADSSMPLPTPTEIHNAVVSLYGFDQFGDQLLAALNVFECAQ
jgi:glycosyltransferase involved in cell wall biosynthesis